MILIGKDAELRAASFSLFHQKGIRRKASF
ncbi:hypothetical protein BPUM_3109 [Bacillus pumilus SAFR-032]|uniref:Uncharacterized protein n=1 Tax=Bacillus pumilus (strain SAFR-032) TaxID=315750 RepID=A8FHP6_BACP2|nr:hypothetical protein BPUM_3109 [Bacillus pumilus SAFR-032]